MSCRLPAINHVSISGHLTGDPESRGDALNFRIANNISYKDRDGNWKDRTCFVNVVLWGKAADRLRDKLYKGSPVVVDGELSFSQWEDRQTGEKKSRIEIKAFKVQAVEKNDDSGGRSSNDGGGRNYDNQNSNRGIGNGGRSYDDNRNQNRGGGGSYGGDGPNGSSQSNGRNRNDNYNGRDQGNSNRDGNSNSRQYSDDIPF